MHIEGLLCAGGVYRGDTDPESQVFVQIYSRCFGPVFPASNMKLNRRMPSLEFLLFDLIGYCFLCVFLPPVNTAGAEVLYKLIADWCNASPTTTVLDICCGTGTIGLSLAKVCLFWFFVCFLWSLCLLFFFLHILFF